MELSSSIPTAIASRPPIMDELPRIHLKAKFAESAFHALG
jgi:hypothetical protein